MRRWLNKERKKKGKYLRILYSVVIEKSRKIISEREQRDKLVLSIWYRIEEESIFPKICKKLCVQILM